MRTKFFSFYTANTPYEALARESAASFALFGLRVKPLPLPSASNWMRNCMMRAMALDMNSRSKSKMGTRTRHGIGLLDSDLTCLRDPVLLKNFGSADGDIGVYDHGEKDDPCTRYSAGVIIFRPTVKGRACLSQWAERCAEDAKREERLREQIYLHDAIEEGRRFGLRVFNIGPLYNQHIDNYKEGDDTVILHHVASRTKGLRKLIGGNL